MKIILNTVQKTNNNRIFMIERKGIGHPDSLADLVADNFSNKFSKDTLKSHGLILNHWVDKIVLRGGKAELSFGKMKIIEPITVYLFGRVTKKVGVKKINITKLFKDSVEEVFKKVFQNEEIIKYINCKIDVNDSVGTDHPLGFYQPTDIKDALKSNKIIESNDTVVCSAFAPFNVVEKLVIYLENFINSKQFKNKFFATGYDVKVLAICFENNLDITICIPFIANKTKNFNFYKDQLIKIKKELTHRILKFCPDNKLSLHINTKDKGEYVYLTAFGTSLDKGDFGAVGRGNRHNGLIALGRNMSIEAVSGKNPKNHSGKLYNEVAQQIANEIYEKYKIQNYINIAAKNGDNISKPAFVFIETNKDIDNVLRLKIEKIVKKILRKIPDLTFDIIDRDVIYHFKNHDVVNNELIWKD